MIFLISWEEKTGNCMKVFFGLDLRVIVQKRKKNKISNGRTAKGSMRWII